MRTLLLILTALISLLATSSGIIMMIIPDGSFLNLSIDMLASSPFNDFFFPGLILAGGVGLSSIIAFCYLLAHHKKQYSRTLIAGTVMIIWMIIEMLLISGIYWPQIFFLFAGVLITLISFQMKGRWLA